MIKKRIQRTLTTISLLLLLGCASTNNAQQAVNINDVQEFSNHGSEYPPVTFSKLSVPAGSQTLTAANRLADELGVEYVEWTKELNPYEYYQLRSKRIHLDFDNPQRSFLQLFDRSGLLAHYDKTNNAVTVLPFSMEMRLNTPHIFTPKFDRSEHQTKQILESYEDRLAKDNVVLEYHFYDGFTIKETINAWATTANFRGVVWYLQDAQHIGFVQSVLKTSDSTIGKTPLAVMNRFLSEKKTKHMQSTDSLTLVVDQSSNLLIVHPYHQNEVVKAFYIEPSSVKYNLKRVADFYGYSLDYRTSDFAVITGYTTVLSTFVEHSIHTIVQQYPLDIEVIDSTKKIIVRGKSHVN